MGDKLIFLGTAGEAPSKERLSSGGFVLQTEGMQFHVDPGPGALLNIRAANINPRENTAILVSHAHVAHCSDINALIAATTNSGSDKRCTVIAPPSLVSTEEGAIPYITQFFRNCVEQIIGIKAGNKIKLGRVEIHATKSVHPKEEDAVGFKFLCPKFTLGYTGDTQYCKEMHEEYKGLDILIFNVQEPFGRKKQGHLSADDVITILNKVKPKLAILTHLGAQIMKDDPLALGREINRRTNRAIIIAKDGMVVNPVDNSAGARQKTLNIYE